MTKMSIIGAILYSLIPFGQLWTRIFDYNGTIDMWWFFIPLFMLPPLQIIPVILLYYGYIKDGNGGAVYDNYVWIPIVTKIILTIVGGMVSDEYAFIVNVLSTIILLISISITKYLHANSSCTDITTTGTKIETIIMDAIFENGVAGIFYVMISFIPPLKMILMVLANIPVIKDIIMIGPWIFGYIFIYITQNMFGHSNMDSFCNPSGISGIYIAKIIIGLILSIIAYLNGLIR